jgi:hypothetical protein
MIKNTIDLIKEDLDRVLYLDLDDFRLEADHEEVQSRFSGLRLRSEFQPIFDTGKCRRACWATKPCCGLRPASRR